jgi:four helix bundle protein
MNNPILLPHHKLLAYGVALQLLRAVRAARIRDPYLRDQAMRAAKSTCLNAAELAGRVTHADKARIAAIARAEAGEAAAGVEIAVEAGDAEPESLPPVLEHANRFIAMMTGIIR